MLASATEVEVELHVPDDVSTFFGVTWAQDPTKDKIFIRAFPRGANGRRGILESTGLVELDDCLTAINGVPIDKSSSLHEVMASIRAAKSPLSLRFARYPPPPPLRPSGPSSSPSSLFSPSSSAPASAFAGEVMGGSGGSVPSSPAADSLASSSGGGSVGSRPRGSGKGADGKNGLSSSDATVARARAGVGDGERRDAVDPDLDGVLNSALVLRLGERVADIQKRNSRLLQEVDRVGRAAADKRQGVERVASAAASLTATGASLLPKHALRLLSAARHDAVALCETMARLDELLAARERAQLARRRALEEEDGRGGVAEAGGMFILSQGGSGGDGLGQGARR